MKIALSTHLFVYRRLDEQLLESIKSHGFSSLELWAMRPHFNYRCREKVREMAQALRRLQMRVSALHAPFYLRVQPAEERCWLSLAAADPRLRRAALEETLAAARVMAVLDCSLLVVHPGGVTDEDSPRLRANLRRSLETLLEGCPPGVRIALENITSGLGGYENVLETVRELSAPRLGICLDLGHANLEGLLPRAIEEAGEKLFHLHASDNDGREDSHLLPLEGNIAWSQVREALRRIGYRGAVSWELRCPEDPFGTLSKIYVNSGKIFPFQEKSS